MQSYTEDEIVVQLRDPARQREAFAKVVSLYGEKLYWHIRKMVLDHEDANDLLQNTFLKAWTNIELFRGEAKLSTWLYKIAINECITFLNKQRNMNNVSIDDADTFLLERLKGYIKGKGERWPYTVQFFFDQETLEYFDEKIKAILTSQYHDALKSSFLLNKKGIPVSRHYQYKDFFKFGTGEYYHEFTAWLYSEEDKEIKENIYRDTYIKVVGIRPEDLAVNLNP